LEESATPVGMHLGVVLDKYGRACPKSVKSNKNSVFSSKISSLLGKGKKEISVWDALALRDAENFKKVL